MTAKDNFVSLFSHVSLSAAIPFPPSQAVKLTDKSYVIYSS